MIVYHGTGDYCFDMIVLNGLLRRTRCYTPRPHQRRKAACTTTDFKIAKLFATRHTLATDFMQGVIAGIVLEYRLVGKTDHDYVLARDIRSLQDESEILVFDTEKLVLTAVWRCRDGLWQRDDEQYYSPLKTKKRRSVLSTC